MSNWKEELITEFRKLLNSLNDLGKHNLTEPKKGDIYYGGIETEQFLLNFINQLRLKDRDGLIKMIKNSLHGKTGMFINSEILIQLIQDYYNK